MAIEVVASDVFTESSSGGPTPSIVTGDFTYPAVSKGMVIMMTFTHNDFQLMTSGASIFDGNTTTQRVNAFRTPGAVGRVLCHINTFPLGDDAGGTVSISATVTGSTNDTGVGVVVLVVQHCNQSTIFTDTGSNNGNATSSSVNCSTAATDLYLDIASINSSSVIGSPGSGQTQLESATDTGGDPISGSSSSKAGTGSTVTSTWTFPSSHFVACCISLIQELPPGPVITSVTKDSAREPSIVNPTDIAVDVVGTDLDPIAAVGPTTLYLADGSNFSTATKVVQAISNLTDTTLDWDVSIGIFPQGDLFLFVVTDEGEVGEDVSAAFPVIVSVPDVHIEMRQVNTVASGGITENFDFDVKAVIGFVVGATPFGVGVVNAAYGFFFTVDGGFDGGICIGSTDGAAQYQREVNINADGSVNILTNGDGAAASKIFGRPSISGQDIDFTFTLTETGYSLNLLVIGGRTVKADAAYVEISDNSYTTGFKPDVLFAATTGETKDSGGDTTFAVSSFGLAVGNAAGDQWSMNNYHGSTTANKNSALRTGFFCNQLNEGAYTWGAALTAFTSTGVTWSGTDTDGMIICMVNTDTLGTFATTVQKPTTATTQVLPDFGFTPSGIILSSCTRTDTSISYRPTQRRTEMGFGFGDSLGNVTAMYAIDGVDGSVSETEMGWVKTKVLLIPNLVSGPELSLETLANLDPIVDSTPSIDWVLAGEASLLGIFGLEASVEEDKSEVSSQMFDI